MQEQIAAIKQLLECNHVTALQIDDILVKALGQQAAWDNCSHLGELSEFEDQFCEEEIPSEFRWIWELLWRSRIDLRDSTVNADMIKLDDFLAHIAVGNSFSLIEGNIKLREEIAKRDRAISHMETEIDSLRIDVKERDQLKAQVNGLEEVVNQTADQFGFDSNDEATTLLNKAKWVKDEAYMLRSQRDRAIRDYGDYRNLLCDVCKKLDLPDFTALRNWTAKHDIAERDREIDILETQINDLNSGIDGISAKQITPDLEGLKKAVDESIDAVLIEKINVLQATIEQNRGAFAKELRSALDLIAERDREIANLKADVNLLQDSWSAELESRDRNVVELTEDLNFLLKSSRESANIIAERDRQIEELKATVNKHREQFENLRSRFQVTLAAIAMNLNSLRGERKPDRIEEVDGVKIVYRSYNDSLTHSQKTIIIEAQQVAIAEEIRKLKDLNLKDFSFDDTPF